MDNQTDYDNLYDFECKLRQNDSNIFLVATDYITCDGKYLVYYVIGTFVEASCERSKYKGNNSEKLKNAKFYDSSKKLLEKLIN